MEAAIAAREESRVKLQLDLTPQAMHLLRQLHETGLFGLTIEEVAERFVYDALIERLKAPYSFIDLKQKKRKSNQ